ncbi:MAG: hypothetical protein IJH31_07275 [Erysipelotrichaceae bacterium]|nr:hypothetical protein [Erysipelotrichaceae bacterium]
MEKTNHEYKKTFDECFCKNVIANYYCDYTNFSKYESPDFISEDICLEIRKALYVEGGKLKSFIDTYLGKDYNTIPTKLLKSLGFENEPIQSQENEYIYYQRRKNDYSLIEYIKLKNKKLILFAVYDHSLFNDQDQVVKEAIDVKIDKLNKHYLTRKINTLGIIYNQQLSYVYEEINNAIVDSIIKKIETTKEQSVEKYYDEIFILFMDCLLKVNVASLEFEKHTISKDVLDQINKNTQDELSKM